MTKANFEESNPMGKRLTLKCALEILHTFVILERFQFI